MPVVRAGSVNISYQEWGEGDPLLLVHGLGMSSDLWIYQTPVLSKRYRMIAVDLRGFGRSDKPSDPGSYDVKVLAADVAAVAKQLGVSAIHFLGSSMGGFVAQELALAEPALFRSLILCHTGCRMSMPPDILESRVKLLRETAMGAYGQMVAKQTFAPGVSQKLADWMVGLIAKNDQRAYTQVLTEGLNGFEACDRIGAIRTPTLVIIGELDRVIPPEEGRELARRIPGAQLVEIAGVGHISYGERPDEFNDAVLRFLDRVSTQR